MMHRWVGDGRRGWRRVSLIALVAAAGVTAGTWLLYGQGSNEGDRIAELLELKPGSRVADVGAGDGEWTRDLAGRVGLSGRVIATEVTGDLVKKLEGSTAALGNVTVVKGTQTESGLPAGCCDAVLIRHVYHHFTNPAAMQADLLRALRPGGLLTVIDFRPNGERTPAGVPATRGGHGIERERLIREMTAAGFTLVKQIDQWPGGHDHYAVLFRRGDGHPSAGVPHELSSPSRHRPGR